MSDPFPLATRLGRVATSQTQQILPAVQRLQRQGIDVIDLGAGEPDFDTPDHIKTAAVSAIERGFTKYTAGAGFADLRHAIAEHYRTRCGARYAADDVVVTSGGKQALFNTALALFGPGDEVIVHVPGWPSIIEQIQLAGADVVRVRTLPQNQFEVRADDVLRAVTPRTRGIVINSPGNPTGALMTEAELQRLAEGVAGRAIWFVLDLCYEQLVYEPVPHNLPGVLLETAPEHTVLVGSASKSYAMTGWRCGWVLASRRVTAACNTVQSHSTSHATSITQHAVLAALTGPQECVTAMRNEYRRRRDALLSLIRSEHRIQAVCPAGAFYLFPDVSALLSPEGASTSADLARDLLLEAHVAVTPGEAFDAPGFLRLSYARSLPQLEDAWSRLQRYLESRT